MLAALQHVAMYLSMLSSEPLLPLLYAQELDFGQACSEELSGSLFARTMQVSVGEGKYMLILNFYIDAALVDARYSVYSLAALCTVFCAKLEYIVFKLLSIDFDVLSRWKLSFKPLVMTVGNLSGHARLRPDAYSLIWYGFMRHYCVPSYS